MQDFPEGEKYLGFENVSKTDWQSAEIYLPVQIAICVHLLCQLCDSNPIPQPAIAESSP